MFCSLYNCSLYYNINTSSYKIHIFVGRLLLLFLFFLLLSSSQSIRHPQLPFSRSANENTQKSHPMKWKIYESTFTESQKLQLFFACNFWNITSWISICSHGLQLIFLFYFFVVKIDQLCSLGSVDQNSISAAKTFFSEPSILTLPVRKHTGKKNILFSPKHTKISNFLDN